MKKLIFLFVILLIPFLCFSQGMYGDFELSVGMPFVYGWLDENGREDTIKTEIPFSFGIGATNIIDSKEYNRFSAYIVIAPVIGIVIKVDGLIGRENKLP